MIKTKAIWKFFYHCLFYNYFFLLAILVLLLSNIALSVVFNLLVGDDLIQFNKWAFVLIQSSIVITLIFLVTSIFYLFNVVKSNDIQKFLILSPYSRSKLFVQKNLFILTCFLVFAFLSLLFQVIISSIFSNWRTLILFLLLFGLSILVAILFGPTIVLIAMVGKGILFVLMSSLLILIVPITFFISRFISPIENNDFLSYDLSHNQNNYVKMIVLDENQNTKEKYLLGIKSYDERVNQNLAINLQDSLNPIKNDFSFFMIGDVFNQIIADFLPASNYSQKQLYELSYDDYAFNMDLVTTENYLSGDPSELNHLQGEDIIYISYQDQDPFEMTYDQILTLILATIDELDLASEANLTFIDSILKKTSQDISWSNVAFSDAELNILQTLAGKDNSFLFYFLKYQNLLKNKTVKLFEDIGNIYNSTIKQFSRFLWEDNKFANNVIKYQTILTHNFITDNFPDIGTINRLQKAHSYDTNFFKNELVHFDDDIGNGVVKILTYKNGYDVVDFVDAKIDKDNPLYEPLSSYESWSDYIDLHSEIVDLEIIYNQLFKINQVMYPSYSFENNQNDFYAVNKILNVKTKGWIDNSWLTIVVLFGISILVINLTYWINKRKGTRYA